MSVDLEERGQALENEYFRRKERELIEKMKAKLEADGSKTVGVKCPKCDGTLVETDFQDIKIDICNECTGVWLDAGELAQIADKEDSSGWFSGFLK
ncbi:MAG: zf-TFIIB domain-containing protein [Pyrinomonadaceae bacterium]